MLFSRCAKNSMDWDWSTLKSMNFTIEINSFGFDSNIHSNFVHLFRSSWSIKFKNKFLKRTNKCSVFPKASSQEATIAPKPDIEQFKIDSFETQNWSSLGTMIYNVYKYLATIDNGSGVSFKFNYTDFLLKENSMDLEQTIVEEEPPIKNEIVMQQESQAVDTDVQMDEKQENISPESTKCSNSINPEASNSIDGSNEDSDAPTNTGEDESKIAAKPKPSRRRGSDLKLLEPWCYWDRNRKYSQRQKNKQLERMENDTTINGILRKMLNKYFEYVLI